MGNLCGKQSKDTNFSGPGRTLDSAPPQPQKATIPARVVGGPPQRLGTTSDAGAGAGGVAEGRVEGGDGARAAAARAAEERAKKSKGGPNKLAQQLDAQRKQTQAQTLRQGAEENLAARNADQATEARNWN